jgi:hypothetical protein
MSTPLTTNAFRTTYKDDFADSSGYHKILFNAGKALQARELTQLQTILQNQIQRFGDNIFKEGAVVKPGGANINPKYEFIKLDTSINTLPGDLNTLVGTTFRGLTSDIRAKVLEVLVAANGDPDTLYVQYTDTSSASNFTNVIRMSAGENISNGSQTLTVQTTNTISNPATGVGTLATLAEGIYYARGHFVFTTGQSKVISRYTDNPSANIGFIVAEDVITASDDASLYDNQGAAPNLTAPGADRYRITLNIAIESEVDSDQNFIHVATVKDGEIFNAIQVNDAYNIPTDVIAKRIFENSGDYIVKPFNINFTLDSESTHLLLSVSPGTAVVDGYRASRTFPTTLRIDKPTETVVIENAATPVDYENSVIVNSNDSSTNNVPNLSQYPIMDLQNVTNYGGGSSAKIGTARVKAINHYDTKLKYHLFDVQLNSGEAFRNVKSIGIDSSTWFNPELENGKAVLNDPFNSVSLYPMSRPRPKAITDISFTVQRRFTATTNGSGQASISLSAGGETFTNVSDWVISSNDGIYYPSSLYSNPSISGNGTTSSTITGLQANKAITILAYVNKSTPTIKTKTLTTRTQVLAGGTTLNLDKADIFDITEIIKAGDSSTIRTSDFVLDNGQRDNYYALGKLNLSAGLSTPDSCQVKYRYFEHGVAGDFFAVNSYTGQVTYDKIPRYRQANGGLVELRNFLDFRSIVHSDGTFNGADARVIEQPQPGSIITSDNEHYLAQRGKLLINREGIISFTSGTPGFSPLSPTKTDQTLPLYDVLLNPNTDNDSDLFVRKLEHQRFTMKDISRLEKRISNVEEVASLSLLEVDTKYLQTLDSSGVDRTKSGFVVDNFSDHRLSFPFVNAGYRASIDPINQLMRPAFFEDNIRMIYDSAESTNTIQKGDNVYIEYDETPYISQNEATKYIYLNPFAVVIYEGLLTLSPSSDEWRDVNRLADKIVQGGTRLSGVNAYNWNNWSWSWGGIPTENLHVGSSTNTQGGMVNRVVSEETILDLVEDRVLQTAFLPFMRARKVGFKVQGLRPNTRVFLLMDGTNISDYARSETFTRYGTNPVDEGNTLFGLTSHPDGTNTLTTDGNGEISGSFIVPNNDGLRFRVGDRQIKFLDISVDNEENAGCIARGTYSAKGFLDTKQSTYTSTRQLNVQGFRSPPPVYYNEGNDDHDHDKGNKTDASTGINAFGGFGGLGGFSTTNSNTSHGYSDQGPGDPDGGVGNEGSKIICTALNEMYGFGSFRNKLWMKYNNHEKALYPPTKISELGYHKVFGPLTEMMPHSKIITRILKRIARVRTDRIKREMSGKPITLESKIHQNILRPINTFVGWLVYKGILSKYKRKGL